ncbi:dTDP-glucose 4,6-dehydratase [Heyndrickxia ginsengihumi]|uniref:dTDP-glucose 4,6-dehydratase n=1 Tax=Heyndrickxia ginsengihumi TaxID=363870 RepID=UPI003D1E4210
MSRELLITGGSGFIGSNFIQYLLDNTDDKITNIDALTYASHNHLITEFEMNPKYRFIKCDITELAQLDKAFDRHYDAIIHFAAESHVDRSIESAYLFIHTNVHGTLNLLEALLKGKASRMVHISTDEVYGSLKNDEPSFTEEHPLAPNNPYSASKASSDLLVRSFYQTYQLPVIITRCSNNYGPYQHEEKLIPKVILHALHNKEIPIYGNGLNIRDWLFVEDHCRAIKLVLDHGQEGEIYNIGGNEEKTNLEIVQGILEIMGKSPKLIKFVQDRLGHDQRYSMNWQKLNRELGWAPAVSFEKGIKQTIEWYKSSYLKMGDSK